MGVSASHAHEVTESRPISCGTHNDKPAENEVVTPRNSDAGSSTSDASTRTPWSTEEYDEDLDLGTLLVAQHSLNKGCPFDSLEDGHLAFKRGNTVVLLDWDDTLFPATFVSEALDTCMPGLSLEHGFSPDSSYFQAMRDHARSVAKLLVTAREVGNVAIVTLAHRPWFAASAKLLPGLDLEGLLQQLKIPVFFACDNSSPYAQEGCESEEVLTDCKCTAMLQFMEMVFGNSRIRKNVVCAGDSAVEHHAVQQAMWAMQGAAPSTQKSVCKCIKFVDQPLLHELSTQVKCLSSWLHAIARFDGDMDLESAQAHGLEMQVMMGLGMCVPIQT